MFKDVRNRRYNIQRRHSWCLRTLSNIGYMSGTLWCVSLEGGVLPLGHVCQWTVRERLLLLSLQPPVAPRHRHSCGGHCPGSLQHSRQPPGSEIKIYSPHPCIQGKRLNSIKGGCNEILGIHFHIFKLPIAAKTEAIYLLVWAQHRQPAAPGSSFGKFKCRI